MFWSRNLPLGRGKGNIAGETAMECVILENAAEPDSAAEKHWWTVQNKMSQESFSPFWLLSSWLIAEIKDKEKQPRKGWEKCRQLLDWSRVSDLKNALS